MSMQNAMMYWAMDVARAEISGLCYAALMRSSLVSLLSYADAVIQSHLDREDKEDSKESSERAFYPRPRRHAIYTITAFRL